MTGSRARLRDLGITVGTLPTGPHNAITDVAGVSVGHASVVTDTPHVVRTGVTVVQPRPTVELDDLVYAGAFSFNGNGELTGSHWLAESGLLAGPIGITNTDQVGLVRDELVAVESERSPGLDWCLPVVGETWDGRLSDIHAQALTKAHVRQAISQAHGSTSDLSDGGPVAEGCVGGGTGMIAHGFKGGIGTASRVVTAAGGRYTVGALVQANYGQRDQLRLDGVPIGRMIGPEVVPLPDDHPAEAHPADRGDTGSIIVVLATDAPLLADQCIRLARRATVGLARVGGYGADSSGDLFLAFATGNRVPGGVGSAADAPPIAVRTLAHAAMTPLFLAAVEAVEESIWNALCMARTTVGLHGRVAHEVPLELLVDGVRRHSRH